MKRLSAAWVYAAKAKSNAWASAARAAAISVVACSIAATSAPTNSPVSGVRNPSPNSVPPVLAITSNSGYSEVPLLKFAQCRRRSSGRDCCERNVLANEALVATQRSSRNLPSQHGSAVYRQDRGESLTSELPDHVGDPGLVASMPDQATQVRCVKLTVRAWRGLDLFEQFTLFWFNLPHRRWSRFRARCDPGRGAPPAHEA